MALTSILLITVLAVVYVSAQENKAVFKEAKCDKALISKIKKLGKHYGNTDAVFQKEGITWIVEKTTGTPKYKDVSCLKYRTEGGGKLTAIKDGVESTVYEQEKGNRIYIKGDNNLHYKFLSSAKKGIYAGYTCSTDGPEISEEQPPNMGLTVTSRTKEEDKEVATQLIEQLGYKLSKVFDCTNFQN